MTVFVCSSSTYSDSVKYSLTNIRCLFIIPYIFFILSEKPCKSWLHTATSVRSYYTILPFHSFMTRVHNFAWFCVFWYGTFAMRGLGQTLLFFSTCASTNCVNCATQICWVPIVMFCWVTCVFNRWFSSSKYIPICIFLHEKLKLGHSQVEHLPSSSEILH